MLWLWIVGGLTAWLVVALGVALGVGRAIRLADRWAPSARSTAVRGPLDVPAAAGPSVARLPEGASRGRRRAVPLPPFGIALAAVAVALETSGYLLRITGGTGTAAHLLAMDGTGSLPRVFIASIFAAAAVVAIAGASTTPGRRSWWLAVGVVAGGIAAGTVVDADSPGGATYMLSSGLAVVGVGILWVASKGERRDRRRVIGILVLYAAAAVGLPALIGSAYWTAGDTAAAATFVAESCKALTGVALLMAVLVGVAPRLVLPGSWALRRSADAHALELSERSATRHAQG